MIVWNELKSNEVWNNRDSDVTILCCSVISLSCEQVQKKFDMTNGLTNFDSKRIVL